MAVDTSEQKQWVKDLTDWNADLSYMGITKPFSWGGNTGQPVIIKYSLDSSKAYYLGSQIDGLPDNVSNLTATVLEVQAILDLISDVTNITFTRDDQAPDIVFAAGDIPLGENPANTILKVNDYTAERADIYLRDSAFSTDLILHETLHALGVSHPKQTEQTGLFADSGGASGFDDSITIMSYNGAEIGVEELQSPETLMPFDIATLQFLYGENTATNAGDTTYIIDHYKVDVVNGSNTVNYTGGLFSFWDAGGSDTYKIADGITEGAYISLVSGENLTEDNIWFDAGHKSYVGLDDVSGNGFSTVLTNAFSFGGDVGTGIIENAIGGGGDDFIIGNQLDNNFEGRGGNDYFYGSTGTDTVIYTGNFSDYNIVEGVTEVTITDVNLSDGDDGQDTLEKIEHIKFANKIFDIGVTTDNADSLVGSDEDYILVGDSGNDTLDAGLGENEVYGGKNDDTITITSGATGTYDGGINNDTFIVKEMGNIDTSVLTLIGGSGTDTITFEGGSYISDQRDPDHVKLLTGDGTFEVELDGFEEVHLTVGTVLANINKDYILNGGPTYDYSFADTSVTNTVFDIGVFTGFIASGSDYSFHRVVDVEIDINGVNHDGTMLNLNISGPSTSLLHDTLNSTSSGSFIGTNNGDTINIHDVDYLFGSGIVGASAGILGFTLGTGNDVVKITDLSTDTFTFTYKGGNDTIKHEGGSGAFLGEDVDITVAFTYAESTITRNASGNVEISTPKGVLTINDMNPQITFSSGEFVTIDAAGTETVTQPSPSVLHSATGEWGNDTFTAVDNSNTLYSTLGGNDIVTAGGGDDQIYGFSGNNQLFGGAGDDQLFGGVNADRLDGGLNDDIISGGAGDDVIFVGEGGDTVTGGSGSDRIIVKAGASGSVLITDFDLNNDVLDLTNVSDISSYSGLNFSQSGADTTIYAEYTNFSIVLENVDFTNFNESNFAFGSGSGLFTNTLPVVPTTIQTGTASADALFATDFNGEVIYGYAGSDTLYGSTGDDYLYGGDGDDYELNGDAGNDVLIGGAGNDELYGSVGDDFYLMDIGVDTGFDGIWDNGGTDALVLSGSIFTFDIALSQTGDMLTVSSTNFAPWQGVNIYDFFAAPYEAGEEYKVEYIVIQDVIYDLEDVYNTGTWTPYVAGNGSSPIAQDDFITIEGGGAFVANVLDNNGNGVDYDTDGLFLEVVPFSQTGAYGTLDVTADGNVSIVSPDNYVGTHTFSYTLRDFDGNESLGTVVLDFVAANSAPIAVAIGAGRAVEEGTALSFTPTFTDADGDTLTYSMSMQDGSVVPNFSIDPNTGLISGTAPIGYATYPIRITAFDGEAEVTHDMNIFVYVVSQGTVNVDYIHGGVGIDYIYGDDAGDSLYGYEGDDALYGELGDDYLYGYEGVDTLSGGAGDDHLYGNEGDDWLYGEGGSDTIYGHEGDDQISGGTEDDYLYGLEGDDWLYGEDGNDRLRGDDDANSDTYVGAGNDVLFGYAGNDNMAGGAGNDILYGGTGNDVLYGNAGDDFLLAEGDNDFLYGGAGTDSLDGGDGVDKLYGEAGTDTLNGGAGTDTLYGGDDNDILIGGTGTDFLYGQGGADTFKLDLTSIDRLSDFDASEGDTIDIADLLIGYNSGADDINDFVTLVYRNAGRTDIRVNDDGIGNDLPYVGIVFSDLTGETVDTLVASGTLIVE